MVSSLSHVNPLVLVGSRNMVHFNLKIFWIWIYLLDSVDCNVFWSRCQSLLAAMVYAIWWLSVISYADILYCIIIYHILCVCFLFKVSPVYFCSTDNKLWLPVNFIPMAPLTFWLLRSVLVDLSLGHTSFLFHCTYKNFFIKIKIGWYTSLVEMSRSNHTGFCIGSFIFQRIYVFKAVKAIFCPIELERALLWCLPISD